MDEKTEKKLKSIERSVATNTKSIKILSLATIVLALGVYIALLLIFHFH